MQRKRLDKRVAGNFDEIGKKEFIKTRKTEWDSFIFGRHTFFVSSPPFCWLAVGFEPHKSGSTQTRFHTHKPFKKGWVVANQRRRFGRKHADMSVQILEIFIG